MKANRNGTPTEQLRFAAKWVGPGDRGPNENRCRECRYMVGSLERVTPKCILHEFATRHNATCRRWDGGSVTVNSRNEEEAE